MLSPVPAHNDPPSTPLSGLVDAHIHFANLYERDRGFPERFAVSGVRACAASHSPEEFLWTEVLRRSGPSFALSYGLHPQSPTMEHAGFLAGLVETGRVEVIGEAGFDFFGDLPDRVRSAENLAAQRQAFEFQLELALGRGLPLLLHVRKAMDLVFEYARRLSKLPAVIFHSWSGTPGEAEAFVRKGLAAYFSFGTTILKGRKAAIESLRLVPESTILSETDAPWQALRGAPFCRFEDLQAVVAGIAEIRGRGGEEINAIIGRNWDAVVGKGR